MRKLSLLLLGFISTCFTYAQPCTATITAGGPTTFCTGGNVVLNANAGGNTWLQKTNFGGSARNAYTGFSAGTKGYIGTGYDGANLTKDFWEYDPSANTWTQKADFGGTARRYAVGFSIGSKGYIGTGYDGNYTKDFWEYDPAGNTWTKKTDFGGSARDLATGFAAGAKGYIGTGNDGNYRKDFWEFDPSANTWTQKTDFGGSSRNAATGLFIGSKGYIGMGYDGNYTKDFWEFDPSANTWTQRTDFGGTPRNSATSFSIGTKGYVGMGFDGGFKKDIWEFSPSANSWTQKADFGGTARNAATSFSINGSGYVGLGYDGGYTKDFWQYNPTLAYAWSNSATTPSIAVTAGGNYTVTVTNTATGCGATSGAITVTVNTPPGIASATAATNPICSNTTTVLTANGVTGTHTTVTWWTGTGGTGTNLGTGVTLTNRGPGTYYARVTGDCGTVAEAMIVVGSKSPTSSVTNASNCSSYTWNGTTYRASGTYYYHTINATGCDSTATLNLVIFTNITSTYTKTDAACNTQSTGAITINPTAGTSPFSYRLGTSGNYTASNNFTGLRAGVYRISILDANGCNGTSAQVTIMQQTAITGNFNKTDATCYGVSNGSISVTPTSGTSPFSYKFGTAGSYGSGNSSTGLNAGDYRVYLQDANGCSINTSVTINQPAQVTGTATVANAKCPLAANGSITITPTAGNAPFSYKLGSTGTYNSSNNFTGLKAGTYIIYIQDAGGCTGSVTATIAQPTIVSATATKTDATCPGAPNGSITVTPMGGTSPYTYRFGSTGAFGTANTFNNLKPGNYRIYINDSNGCSGYSIAVTISAQSSSCSSLAGAKFNTTHQENNQRFKAVLSPNPSTSRFSLVVRTADKQAIQLKVSDINGHVIYTGKALPNQLFTFGEQLSQGIYMVEARQGNEVKMLKAIKIR